MESGYEPQETIDINGANHIDDYIEVDQAVIKREGTPTGAIMVIPNKSKTQISRLPHELHKKFEGVLMSIMNRKNPLLIFLVMLATFTLISRGVVTADPTATLSVTPQTTTGAVGDTFSIEIYLNDVVNLWGFEFRLFYDTSILTATTSSCDWPDVSINEIDDAQGLVHVSASLPVGVKEGVDGDFTLATIEFSVDAAGESDLDIDETYTPLLITPPVDEIPVTVVDGFFTTLGEVDVHDIAVTNVTASPTKVAPGESVSIEVTVANEGDFDENFNVTISFDGTIIETRTDVPLATGASTTLTFTWNTTDVAVGIYDVTVDAIVDDDNEIGDNTDSVMVTIGDIHDIAVITATLSQTKVAPGESVSIEVTVANEGDFDENFNVTIKYGVTVIGQQTDVSLAPAASTTLTFTWDTTGLPEGPYPIRAEVIVDVDDDLTNNTKDAGVLTIESGEEGEQETDTSLYLVAAAIIAVGAVAVLGFYILKVRKPTHTATTRD